MIDRWPKFGSVKVYERKFPLHVCVFSLRRILTQSSTPTDRRTLSLKTLEDLRARIAISVKFSSGLALI